MFQVTLDVSAANEGGLTVESIALVCLCYPQISPITPIAQIAEVNLYQRSTARRQRVLSYSNSPGSKTQRVCFPQRATNDSSQGGRLLLGKIHAPLS
jgi:hypothetical protein